jgi:hypothetical protein
MATRSYGSRISGEYFAEIQRLAIEDWSPSQIHKCLEKYQREAGIKDPPPDVRTVQRIVRQVRASDPSGPWSPANGELSDVRAVLDVLAAVIEHTEGRTISLTNGEALWVERLNRAAPGLPPLEAWRLARLYLARAARNDSTEDLDVLLAFAPWRRAEEGWARYHRVTTVVGRVPRAPSFLVDSLENKHLRPDYGQDSAPRDRWWRDFERRNREEVAWLCTPAGTQWLLSLATPDEASESNESPARE